MSYLRKRPLTPRTEDVVESRQNYCCYRKAGKIKWYKSLWNRAQRREGKHEVRVAPTKE